MILKPTSTMVAKSLVRSRSYTSKPPEPREPMYHVAIMGPMFILMLAGASGVGLFAQPHWMGAVSTKDRSEQNKTRIEEVGTCF